MGGGKSIGFDFDAVRNQRARDNARDAVAGFRQSIGSEWVTYYEANGGIGHHYPDERVLIAPGGGPADLGNATSDIYASICESGRMANPRRLDARVRRFSEAANAFSKRFTELEMATRESLTPLDLFSRYLEQGHCPEGSAANPKRAPMATPLVEMPDEVNFIPDGVEGISAGISRKSETALLFLSDLADQAADRGGSEEITTSQAIIVINQALSFLPDDLAAEVVGYLRGGLSDPAARKKLPSMAEFSFISSSLLRYKTYLRIFSPR